jgi:predicted  nucleic acid-binding Zn-ribbon protein
MLPVVADLLQLQERDQRLRALIKDYKDVPVLQQRAKLQLADDTAATSAALLGMREVEVKIKSIELDIQTLQNSIKRLQDQQFETRKNDEFQAMGNEVIRYQKEINTLEDRIIEHMEQLEAAKEIHRLASEKLAATTSRVNEEIVQLEERGKNLEVRIADLKAERAGLTTGLDAASMGMYDRLILPSIRQDKKEDLATTWDTALNNYANWLTNYPSLTGTNALRGADPDGDGFNNGTEFAFDGNPTIGSPAFLTATKVGTNAIFNYVARKNPPGGVSYQVKVTPNLSVGPWTDSAVTISNSTNQSGLNVPADYERKEFSVPATNNSFYRVHATIAP